ncbi:hypothetical protein F4777DRAFT_408343 [Nemania sp. FL0916]|nr:hypothetical protein F4777DRAFT_408343 [Nemania sp. FL0916]
MSEDVSRFLSQVKELGERRIEEDEARSRELEEKILQDRRERQARRRERARSFSPQKSSPANTPPPTSQPTSTQPSERLHLATSLALNPPSSSQSQSAPRTESENEVENEDNAMSKTAQVLTSPSKENQSPLDVDVKPNPNLPPSPTRSGTIGRGLSWQRRPNSQGPERSRSQPLSSVAAENATRSSNAAPEQATPAETPSRDQIASALSSKDPSWFRQTADRGASSAAYRRTQVEDTQTVDPSSAQSQLPGMSRSISGESSRNGDPGWPSSRGMRSSIVSPTNLSDAQRLGQPPQKTQLDDDSARGLSGLVSPPLGRTSPTRMERPVSPTKGMGGFVQSAMMKRSESVSKRWNVQSSTAFQRADLVASNRNSFDPTSRARATSKTRPTSSTESLGLGARDTKEEDQSASRTSASLKLDTATSPEPQGEDSSKTTPPVSPSKTMDPRRWSPQKSSWLESALSKPESPKPKLAQPPPNQPAWMAELQKAKAQKANNPATESSKTPTASHKHQVSIGGLLRSSAPGSATTPVGPGSLHGSSPSTSSINTPVTSARPSEPQASTVPSLVKSKSEPLGEVKPTGLPSINKPTKPATPPKKDFRANLKPRAPPTAPSTSSQNVEFKNIFGHLRKTTTQNYVAPDELKDNITRGKAALAVTGGPQKSERVDEFKEAILAKKKEFQTAQSEGRSIPRNSSISSETPIPEGLLKRAELGRSGTIKRDPIPSDLPATDARRPSVVSQRDSGLGNLAGRFERSNTLEKRTLPMETPNLKPEGQSILTEPSSSRSFPSRQLNNPLNSSHESNGPARLPGKLAGSALANRFNPALAGLLSRGPPAATPNSGTSLEGIRSSGPKAGTDGDQDGSGPKLTHMTKNRARGPKRKAPTMSPVTTTTTAEPKPKPVRQWGNISSQHNNAIPSSQATLKSPVASKEPSSPIPVRPKPIGLTGASKSGPASTPSDVAIIDQSDSESKIHEQIATLSAREQQPLPSKISETPQQISPRSPSPGKLNMNRMSRFMDATSTTNKGNEPGLPQPSDAPHKMTGLSDKTLTLDAQQTPQPRSPSLNKPKVPLPAPLALPLKQRPSKDEVEVIATEPESKVAAPLGPRPLPKPPVTAPSEPQDTQNQPLSKEPEMEPRPLPTPVPKSTSAIVSPLKLPPKQSPDTSGILRDFFGSDRPQRNYRVDAAEILMDRPALAPPRIKTLSAQLFQFSADGKKQPVPAHRERTLFEHEMYLCTHTFNNESGAKVLEAYFWVGSEVSPATAEDAAIFVSREARSFGGTLINLEQGKETPEFLQALGGIVIIQRGSGNKYDSLAPHMLCGRRYHGHVVFDEVDFTSSALCSGFPYIIIQGAKCYLWKGKGSHVDELSCARLIGMDFALSGEMEEVEESNEPEGFWDLFDGAKRFGSADHWRLKPNYDKYCSRLFVSNAASHQQIVELAVFAQADLQPNHIYVIDAFFELYIVVGSRAQDQYASFHNALEFAQEYAILAASVEDRPFMPVSTVVLEGIPRDMKSVFRKWQDQLSPTVTNIDTGLKRGRSLKVVTLNQALQALSE